MDHLAFPYQIEGAEILARAGSGILADDMGLGKGLTSLLWLNKIGAKRTLVTGPKEITSNLKNEIPKWVKDKPLFDLRGYAPHLREDVFNIVRDFDEYIAIISLESWRKDSTVIDKLVSLQFDSLLIDEAHHINNGRTLSYKGVHEIIYAVNKCPDCGYLITPRYMCRRENCTKKGTRFQSRRCLSCGHMATKIGIPKCDLCGCDPNGNLEKARSIQNVLEMTGTPLLNKPLDLLWLLSLVDERFHSPKEFLKAHCKPAVEGGGKYVWSPYGKRKLVKMIAPYYVRRLKKDVGLNLPPQTIETREYDFDKAKYPEQWKAYKKLEDGFRIELESEVIGITEVVVQLLRLRQMLVWPQGIVVRDPETKEITGRVGIANSFKLDIVDRLSQEFLETQRIAVFSQFKEPLHELQRRLGARSVVYDGSTPDSVRQAIRQDFRAGTHTPRWDALLCNYRSAGEGLNLPGATATIILDEQWNPGKNKQAYDRTLRLDQTKATKIVIPRVLGTVDDWMAELNEFKSQIVDGFDAAVNWRERLLDVMDK